MHKPVQAIEVRIWGKTVGAVALAPNLGYFAFEYDSRFVKSGVELAPLTMPLSESREPFVFTDLPELSFKRLPAMVADALPDDFGTHSLNCCGRMVISLVAMHLRPVFPKRKSVTNYLG